MSYDTATFTRLDRNANGTAALVLTYTGNAGEPPVDFTYPVDANSPPSADYMRGLAMARLSILNNNRNFITGATPFIGTVLDTVTPLPSPATDAFGEYSASSAAFTPGATPQDVFTISGSATKIVRVTRMIISTTQTTAGANRWALVKRSTANSGGTSSAVAAVPTDSLYPAASAVVRAYTANPTAGTLVGTPWAGRVTSPTAVLSTASLGPDIQNPMRNAIAVLRGAAESFSWNFGGAVLPAGLLVNATVWWTED